MVSGKYIGYVLALIAFAIPLVLADPAIITLQGKLTTSSDAAITTASFRINITNDSAPSQAALQWGPFTFNNSVDSNGVFNLPLGAVNALDLDLGSTYRIVLEIDDGAATFATADVIFGDANPAADAIKFVNGQPDGKPRFKGVTSTNYSGSMGGVFGANAKCNTEFSGSHICTDEEVLRSGMRNISLPSWVYRGEDEEKNCQAYTTNATPTNVAVDSNAASRFDVNLAFVNGTFARIAYYDNLNGNLIYIECKNENCSSNTRTLVENMGLGVNKGMGDDADITIGNDSLARLSYANRTSAVGLRYTRCLNDACSSKVYSDVYGQDVGVDYTSIAVAPDGTARIAVGKNGNQLFYIQCLDVNCSTNSTTSVGTVTDSYINLAIGKDGFGRIINKNNGKLKYTQCTNNDCSLNTITALNDASGYSDIAIGDDGFARISFQNTDADLGYVRCYSDDCLVNIQTPIRTTSDTDGLYSKIVVGRDNFARMVHVSTTFDEIRLIRCLNDGCTSYTTTTFYSGNIVQEGIGFGIDDRGNVGIAYNTTASNINGQGTGSDALYYFHGTDIAASGYKLMPSGKVLGEACNANLPIACCK